MDKCMDYGPISNGPHLKEVLSKQSSENGAQVQEFGATDNSTLISPIIIKNAALNSHFNLSEVSFRDLKLIPKFDEIKLFKLDEWTVCSTGSIQDCKRVCRLGKQLKVRQLC